MSSFRLDQNGDCIDDIPVDRLLSSVNDRRDAVSPQIPSDSYDEGDEFGEPEIPPRIGDEYQAELPPLIRQPKHIPYTEVGHQLLPSVNDCRDAVIPQIPSDSYDAGDEFGEPEIPPRIGDEYQAELPPLIRQPTHIPYTEVGHRLLPSVNDCGDAVIPQIPSDSYDAGDEFGEPEIPPRIGDEYQAELPPLIRQPKHIPYTEVGHRLLPSVNNSGDAVIPQIPSDCCDAEDVFGESEIPPQIGDEYQAELPPVIQQPNRIPYSEVGHNSLQDFLIGLPIPLTWMSCPNHAGPQTVSEPKHPYFKNDTETEVYGNVGIESKEESRISPAMRCGEDHILVPGLVSDSWSDGEKASFLLALYIFEKNFVEVRKFVETKDMGAILSFFYGEFYNSDVCRRWSEGRKTRSKKCVYGQRIFSGLRQQELLSRLTRRVSEECKSALLEATKAFGEEKMSLAEYVSSLKATVGMNALVEAVGIGTGKQDLTGMAIEPIRSNHAVPTRPEIPAGKACSSLTTSEIVKFLSGDYRLSKARSNDLFWEAVWPRLLARGWHSEQPQNQGYIGGLKHSLVFLLPGVKKFSRRKLVKGKDYFDSITDVLSKVGKEPGLIELENEEVEADVNNKREEEKVASERQVEENEKDQPTRQRHCYLQPRIPNRGSTDDIKFTVVDTSLPGGCVRELRSLPSQVSTTFRPEDSNESEVSTKSGGKNVSKSSAPLKDKEFKENKKARKVSKPVLSRKQKKGSGVDDPAPLSKRCRKLIANDKVEKRDVPALENGVSCCESNGNLSTQVSSSCQDKLSSTSSSKGSPCESIEQAQEPALENPQSREPSKAREPPQKNHQPQLLIDLNLPQVPPEFENDVLPTNSRYEADDQSVKIENQYLPSSSVVEARPEEQAARPEEQPVVNPRRLSTRYRPPTTRTLEAVANGYLTVSRRRKRPDTSVPSRPAQRPRGGAVSTESPNSFVASKVEEGERGASSSGTHNVPNNAHDQTGGNEESHLRQ